MKRHFDAATEKALSLSVESDELMSEAEAYIKASITTLLFSPSTVAPIDNLDCLQIGYSVDEEDDCWSSSSSSGCCADSLSEASTETEMLEFFLSDKNIILDGSVTKLNTDVLDCIMIEQ